MVTGTRRLPSAFELPPSTAPTRVESNPPSSTPSILPNLMPNLRSQYNGIRIWERPRVEGSSSTVQGLQRIVHNDIYQPGTIPERAYKRVYTTREEGINQEAEGSPVLIPESPERRHKTPLYTNANTVSQLAETGQFSVPTMSQMGLDFN